MSDAKIMTSNLQDTVLPFRKILENLHEGYILVDEDANIHDVNSAYCNMVGYTKEELLSMKLSDVRPGMTLQYQKEFIEDVIERGSVEFETHHKAKDGTTIDLNASAAVIKKDGKIYLAGFVRDITEKKASRREAKESRRRFQSLFKHNPHSVYFMDLDGNYRGVNAQMVALTGYSEEGLLNLNFAPLITEKDLEKTRRHFEEAASGKIQEYEIEGVTKQGDCKPVRITNFPMIINDEVVGVFGIAEDISARKKAEHKLKESEQNWQRLVENNPQPVQVTKGGIILFINQAGADLYAADSPGQLIGKSIFTFNPPHVQKRIKQRIQRMEKDMDVDHYHEHSIIDLNGNKRYVKVHSTPINYQGKKAVQTAYHDITERKLAEKKLKESEGRWQRLVEDNPKAVQVTIDGKIVFINEAGVALYEAKSSKELMGMSVLEFTHPADFKNVKERKNKLENDLLVDQIHENRMITLAGKERHIEVHSIPITYKGKKAVQTVIYDVTDRNENESLIRQSLKEKEVLLQEIHHRVKNNMAVVSGLLQLQAMNTENEEVAGILKESEMRIYSMAMIHEKLYASESLSEINFEEYIKELSQTIINSNQKNHKNITIKYNLQKVHLDINKAIPCGLILNELIVNCFKHAFKNRDNGTILIGLSREESRIKVLVEDNGCGLPDGFDINSQGTLGMTLVKTLTKQLEGELTISEGKKNLGSRFVLLVDENG